VAAWCLFDFANSSYATVIVTLAFAVFFREVVVNGPGNVGDKLWGMANFIAMAVVVLVSPLLGALADYSGRRKLLLVLTTLLTVVATLLLYTVGEGQLIRAMLLFVLATIGFECGYVFYNAFLPEVSTPETIGRVSGWGWAVGYFGGLAALALCAPWLRPELRDASGALSPAAIHDRQIAFAIVGGFYLLFALPSFLWLRESAPLGAAPARLRDYVGIGLRRVRHTLRHLREHREVGKFVLASLFYTDGISTVIVFAALFASTTFGFSSAKLIALFLVLNVVAVPGAALAGHLADAIGAKRTLVLSLLLWIGVLLTGWLARSELPFWIMASGAAIGMGATQSVGRSFMAQISPPEREAEFFGFYVLSGKFASTLGPLIFGLVSSWTGEQRLAVLSLLPLFVAGLLVLLTVDASAATPRR